MNELEATRAKLKCLKMVEGTNLKWWEVVRWTADNAPLVTSPLFDAESFQYKFALGVVEGKPVWEGDTLYHSRYGKVLVRKNDRSTEYFKIEGYQGGEFLATEFSWNPLKPKTVMVELLVEDAECISNKHVWPIPLFNAVEQACRKALEKEIDLNDTRR